MNNPPDQIAARSAELFNQGFCCAESVLQAVAESQGIQSDLIPRIATGLCGGIGRSGNICGAVTGGVLAINLATGRTRPGDPREANDRLVKRFLEECEVAFGTTNCEKLMGCRLDTPEGMRFFKEHNLREKCAGISREAARIASRLLQEENHDSTSMGCPAPEPQPIHPTT